MYIGPHRLEAMQASGCPVVGQCMGQLGSWWHGSGGSGVNIDEISEMGRIALVYVPRLTFS
jgi:hypothetical protein